MYEVNGSDIQWYYKSTGKPKEHQLRVYGRGSNKEKPDEILANVWNWDKSWKIEWWEDGQPRGLMQQRIGLDPWAVELYSGPNCRPNTSSWSLHSPTTCLWPRPAKAPKKCW